VSPERDALEGWLDFHRATLLHKCAGLTAEQLAMRACPPSTLSLLGLLRHLTDVERGDPSAQEPAGIAPLYWGPVAAYRLAVDASRSEAARHDLDEVVPRHPENPEAKEVIDVRWIYLHMIEEYARHNGHADLLRQAIDGTTGE
jgi:hypothetical protein